MTAAAKRFTQRRTLRLLQPHHRESNFISLHCLSRKVWFEALTRRHFKRRDLRER
jgi:hypothetical protein